MNRSTFKIITAAAALEEHVVVTLIQHSIVRDLRLLSTENRLL